MSEHENWTLTRFYDALPPLPEGQEAEAIAVAVSHFWKTLEEFVQSVSVDGVPEQEQEIVGRFIVALNMLGDPRIAELAEMPYAEYLQSREWRARACVVKARAGGRCQLCNASNSLHAHHRTYEHRGYERWDDLIALCSDCHAEFHATRKLAD